MERLFRIRARLARKTTESGDAAHLPGSWLRRGLTLVELSIVILVLGILMVVLFANLDIGVADKAQRLQVISASKQLKIWWNQYEYEYNQLEEGTAMSVLSEKSSEAPGWRPVDEQLTMDPWKRPYFICLDENGDRQICSLGADGEAGGEGNNQDFYLTEKSSWPAWLSQKKTEE